MLAEEKGSFPGAIGEKMPSDENGATIKECSLMAQFSGFRTRSSEMMF